jgi:hypothetical protein
MANGRRHQNLEDSEREFWLLGTLLGASPPPDLVTFLFSLSAMFLLGVYLAIGENHLPLRLFGAVLMVGSLVGVWVLRDSLRKRIKKLRQSRRAAERGDPVTPADKPME